LVETGGRKITGQIGFFLSTRTGTVPSARLAAAAAADRRTKWRLSPLVESAGHGRNRLVAGQVGRRLVKSVGHGSGSIGPSSIPSATGRLGSSPGESVGHWSNWSVTGQIGRSLVKLAGHGHTRLVNVEWVGQGSNRSVTGQMGLPRVKSDSPTGRAAKAPPDTALGGPPARPPRRRPFGPAAKIFRLLVKSTGHWSKGTQRAGRYRLKRSFDQLCRLPVEIRPNVGRILVLKRSISGQFFFDK
jgi:hypothetical protein